MPSLSPWKVIDTIEASSNIPEKPRATSFLPMKSKLDIFLKSLIAVSPG
jgi:hypothetical protein